MTQPNCASQATPAGGAVKAFHAVGWREFSAIVVVDEAGEIVNTFGGGAGLTDTQLRATPVPVSGIVVSAPAVPSVSLRVSAAPAQPAANAVIIDSGQLGAGQYRVEYSASAMDTVAVGKGMLLEHRNAVNNATLHTLAGVNASGAISGEISRITVAANERLRWIAGTAAGAASSKYAACITLYAIT
jgi:hypothetical protein